MDYENFKSKNTPANPYLIIRKLVDLIDHPISGNANERNLQLLRNFLNASHYAFYLPTIPDVIRLYEIISKKIETVPEFKEPFECLLHFSAIPPMLTKVSDQIEYARDFQEYFSTLGYLIICLHDEELSKLVLNAIIHLLKIRKPLNYCVTLDYTKEMIERSKLPEILVQLTQVVSDTLYPLLLEAMLLVSGISKSTARKMAQENGIEYLLRRLEPIWQTRDEKTKPQNPTDEDKIPHVETTCCILWKLLNSVQNDTENIPIPTSFALRSFQYALRWSFIIPGHRIERNNLAAIILKILATFPQIEFVESALVDDVTLLAISATGQIPTAKQDETEFQFKKIILACLFYYKNYKVDKVVTDHNVMNALIMFLSENGAVNHTHYCGLVKIVIKLIPEFLPISVDTFLALDAPSQITSSLKAYMTNNIHVLEACMYCTHKSLQANDGVLVAFAEASVFAVAALVCNEILDNATLTNVHQKCIGRGFCILQIVASAGYGNGKVLLDLCLKYLSRVVHPKQTDPVLDVRITACALHSLWHCVNDKNHSKFVKKGGAYILLDVAEACTFPAKSLVLGIMVDLLRRSVCVPYLITWRKHGLTLLPMLMEIFRAKAENSCSGKKRFSSEKIDNTGVALCRGQRPTFQNYCITQNEMLQSCRYRIHGIINALKVKHKQKVILANNHYKLYTEKLNTDDELTMLFAENFLSLTMCETWIAIVKELEVEGIVPVDSDSLSDKINGIRQWKKFFRSQIEKKVADEFQSEKKHEYETYVLLNEARLSDALDALKEVRFVSNCTERMFRLSKKIRLSQEVEPLYKKNINYHRTALNLPFTNIFDQTIKIESDVIYANEEEFDLAPVSSGSESEFDIKYSEDKLSEHGLEC